MRLRDVMRDVPALGGEVRSGFHSQISGQYLFGLAHSTRDPAAGFQCTRLLRRKVDTVLPSKALIQGFPVDLPGNEEADKVGDHERHNDGVVPRDLEDQDDGGHGRAHNSGEYCAHSH